MSLLCLPKFHHTCFVFWCERWDSNPHVHKGHGFLDRCVYQFRHSRVILISGTGGGDRTHTEWILSPLPLPDWATPALYSGAEEETRTPKPFGTGILNRHVYQFHHFRVIHIWCGWWDSNPHAIRQGILSPQCLPIPPHPRGYILVRVEGVEPPTCCF